MAAAFCFSFLSAIPRFFRRHRFSDLVLPEWEKIIENIEKGEGKLRQRQEIQDALTAKVKAHRIPLQQLQIKYLQTRGKNFTEEEDRFLVSFVF